MSTGPFIGPRMVGIDPFAMSRLISQTETAGADLQSAANSLSSFCGGVCAGVSLSYADAATVAEAATWLTGQVPGLKRRRALAEVAGRLQPWADGVFGVISLDPALLERFATPDAAMAEGAAAAQRLKSMMDGHEIDPQLAIDLEALRHDPYFAQGFITAMGVEKLAQVPASLAEMRERYKSLYGNPANSPEFAKFDADSLALLRAVDNTFADATRGTSDVALPATFADDLLATLPQRGFEVSSLLRFGNFDSAFLSKLASGIYQHEQTHSHRGYWADAASRNNSRAMPTIGEVADGFFDPMVGVMTALGRNPVSAQDFLGDTAKLEYFATQRVWGPDGGNAFGAALVSATTVLRDRNEAYALTGPSRGWTSARIASESIHFIAKSGYVYSEMRDSVGDVLAEYISDVGASARSKRNGEPGVLQEVYADLPPQPWGASFSIGELRTVMNKTFESTDAFKTVNAAALSYSKLYYEQMAKQLAATGGPAMARDGTTRFDPSDFNKFQTATAHAASLFGLIFKASNTANIDDAERRDEQAKAMRDLANSSFDLLPMPGKGITEKVAGAVFGEVKDKFFDGMAPGYTGKARIAADDNDSHAKLILTDLAAAVMMDQGLFGSAGPPPAPTHPAAHWPKGSAGYFLDANGSIVSWKTMSVEQQHAYGDWLTESGSNFTSIEGEIRTWYNDMSTDNS